MSESAYNGYVLDAQSPRSDVNAPGGVRSLCLIAIARSRADAKRIGMHLGFPNCEIRESGLDVLKRAKALNVDNDDARALEV